MTPATDRPAYLETQVHTASPQRLRLMLIEGAIRFAKRAQAAIAVGALEQVAEALERCRAIAAELLAGVRPDGTPLTRQVAGIYVFVIKQLTEAELRHDAGEIEEVISVLEIERETWQHVCENMPEAPEAAEGQSRQAAEITAAGKPAILPSSLPHSPARSGLNAPAVSQFSIEG